MGVPRPEMRVVRRETAAWGFDCTGIRRADGSRPTDGAAGAAPGPAAGPARFSSSLRSILTLVCLRTPPRLLLESAGGGSGSFLRRKRANLAAPWSARYAPDRLVNVSRLPLPLGFGLSSIESMTLVTGPKRGSSGAPSGLAGIGSP